MLGQFCPSKASMSGMGECINRAGKGALGGLVSMSQHYERQMRPTLTLHHHDIIMRPVHLPTRPSLFSRGLYRERERGSIHCQCCFLRTSPIYLILPGQLNIEYSMVCTLPVYMYLP